MFGKISLASGFSVLCISVSKAIYNILSESVQFLSFLFRQVVEHSHSLSDMWKQTMFVLSAGYLGNMSIKRYLIGQYLPKLR